MSTVIYRAEVIPVCANLIPSGYHCTACIRVEVCIVRRVKDYTSKHRTLNVFCGRIQVIPLAVDELPSSSHPSGCIKVVVSSINPTPGIHCFLTVALCESPAICICCPCSGHAVAVCGGTAANNMSSAAAAGAAAGTGISARSRRLRIFYRKFHNEWAE